MTDFSVADQALQWLTNPRQAGFRFGGKLLRSIEPRLLKGRMLLREARKMELTDDFVNKLVNVSAANSKRMLDRCDLANLHFKSLWVEYDNPTRVKAQFPKVLKLR